MKGGTNVIPGIQLVHVESQGVEVTADVFGGDDPVIMAEVVFRVDDPVEHQHVVRTFREWEGQGRVLTLVRGTDGVVTLLDEDAAFDSALG